MNRTSKTLALFFTFIISISCLTLQTVKPANAQSTPTLSVPQFTAKFIDASYNKVSTDPYTGKQVTQFILNRTIEITIQNQPLAAHNSSGTSFYYNIRMKGDFESEWTNVSSPSKGLLVPSSSQTTVYSYTEGEFSNAPPAYEIGNFFFQPNPNDTAKIDIQVEALIGSIQPAVNSQGIQSRWVDDFVGQESGWSNTQTLTIPPISNSPAPTETSTPAVPELSWLVIVPLLASIFFAAAQFRLRKDFARKKANA